MKAKEYLEKFPITGTTEEKKAVVLNVAKEMLKEAEEIIRERRCEKLSAKAAVYHELRRKFEAYLKLNNSYSDGKMKLFDALMIPMKKGIFNR